MTLLKWFLSGLVSDLSCQAIDECFVGGKKSQTY